MILGLLRIIIWGIIFFLIYKVAVSVMKIFTDNKRAEREKVEETEHKSKYNIDKKDIIEADFEDIKTGEKDNSKENT